MALVDFGVAFVIVLGLAIAAAVIIRGEYQRRHPPLTTEQRTAQLEADLAEVNKQIKEAEKKWDM